jgi:riboflavin kinase/FMN adenylyltransferase
VLTLGNFDGLHRGHQHLIRTVVRRARERGLEAAAVTFDPHPARLHRPEQELVLLQSLPERLAGLEALGLDGVLVAPYTLEFAALTPEEFVRRYLVDGLGAREVVLGRDTKFGAGNAGDLETMRELGERLGFEVSAIEDQGDLDGGGRSRWSSSAVRAALARGDVLEANRILGHPHRVAGEVVRGDGRGRLLGFPTANLGGAVSGLIPADGVYAGYLEVLNPPAGQAALRGPAAISVGVNPTFAGRDRRVEAHVLCQEGLDLYGRRVAVDFVEGLRHTLTFANQEALVAQMHDDVARAREVLRAARLAECPRPAARPDA